MSKDSFTVQITNIVPYLKDHDIQDAVCRVIDRNTLLRVQAVTPVNCKSSNFVLHLKTESAQKRLFSIKRLYVKEYVLRMEPSSNHPDVDVYRRKNPPRLKLMGLPPYLKPCDLKELCIDAKAVFWEMPWSTRHKRYENFATVEFDRIEDCMAALHKPISLDGKPLVWQEVGGVLRRHRSPELRDDISDPINVTASVSINNTTKKTSDDFSKRSASASSAVPNSWNLSTSALSSYESVRDGGNNNNSNNQRSNSRSDNTTETLIVNSSFLGRKRDNHTAFLDDRGAPVISEDSGDLPSSYMSPIIENFDDKIERDNRSKQRRLRLEENSGSSIAGQQQQQQPIHHDFMLKLLDRIAAMQSEYLDRTQNMVEKNMNQLNQIYSILLEQSKFQEKLLSLFTQQQYSLHQNNTNQQQLHQPPTSFNHNDNSNALKSKIFLSNLESTLN